MVGFTPEVALGSSPGVVLGSVPCATSTPMLLAPGTLPPCVAGCILHQDYWLERCVMQHGELHTYPARPLRFLAGGRLLSAGVLGTVSSVFSSPSGWSAPRLRRSTLEDSATTTFFRDLRFA